MAAHRPPDPHASPHNTRDNQSPPALPTFQNQLVPIRQPNKNVPDLLQNQPQNTFRSPPKTESFKASALSPAVQVDNRNRATPPKTESPPLKKDVVSPPKALQTKKEYPSPPKRQDSIKTEPVAKKKSAETVSPPVATGFKIRTESKGDDKKSNGVAVKKEVVPKEEPINNEVSNVNNQVEKAAGENDTDANKSEVEKKEKKVNEESNGVGDKIKKFEKAAEDESNGVGDKIKIFEKAAEDASVGTIGRMSRAGSIRSRARSERLGSDSKEDLPPPATPFKDNVHFELSAATSSPVEKTPSILERQQSLTKNSTATLKWQRSDSSEVEKIKPEPQKIIKPEFKPIVSPVEVTIRSPSLGAKLPDQFPSHGTAFRNVASPDPARTAVAAAAHKFNEDVNTQNNVKPCKLKNKEKYSVSKGSSYFTRGSEEIWLVKKKDIEEIEERVLDSFRRAGGNICMRSESMRPSSDSGQGASFTHATMGRTKRQMYARSESLDPQWAGARSQTLKRQSSVACTCGHDKKTRAKSAGAEANSRPRSRSHGDDNNQAHVLDKYETLV